jgi:hypothetical protein
VSKYLYGIKREPMYKGIAIGDVHLCEKNPICRKDDVRVTQLAKLQQVVNLCNEYQCPLLVAGDMYDVWNIGFKLVNDVNLVLSQCQHPIYFVAGNHDLPYHSLEHYYNCPLSVTLGTLLPPNDTPVTGCSWGETPSTVIRQAPILLQHKMVYLTDPIKGFDGDQYNVRHLINTPEYKNYKLIITGDNHRAFVYTNEDGRVWLNTGPIVRTSVTEKLYEPSAWYFEVDDTVSVTRLPLAVDVDAVDRIDMYVEKIKSAEVSQFAGEIIKHQGLSLDFKKSVDSLLTSTEVTEPIKNAALSAIYEAEQEN